jgi:hypothetical protein
LSAAAKAFVHSAAGPEKDFTKAEFVVLKFRFELMGPLVLLVGFVSLEFGFKFMSALMVAQFRFEFALELSFPLHLLRCHDL